MRTAIFSTLAMAMLTTAAPAPEPQNTYDMFETFAEGDGDPYQVYLYNQLSDRSICGDEDGTVACTVGQNDMTSYTVSWGAGIAAAGWINAGFSVSKAEITGNTHLCTNNAGDGTLKKAICIWKRVGHTEYTVKDWTKRSFPGAEWSEYTDAYQMWSPNTNNVGHDYICAWDDECQTEGDEWWGPSRTPGGPKPYKFSDKWQ